MILINLNATDDRPIYAQVLEQVKFGIASGALRPGEMVPSVRELSKRLVVNPNTVARAYRDLQSEGLLGAVRGTGLQVTEEAPERCRAGRLEIVRRRLRGAMEEARRSGLDVVEVEAMIRDEWARSNGVAASGGATPGDQGGRQS